jgi:hypothetical protein
VKHIGGVASSQHCTPENEGEPVTKSSIILASVIAAGALTGPATATAKRWRPPPVDPARIVRSANSWELQSNTTQTFSLKIAGIPKDFNILLPCGGYDIKGSGVDLAAVNLIGFGPVDPLPGKNGTPDGGIHFAERQPDGSYVIPESRAVVTFANQHEAIGCALSGYHWYDSKGNPNNVALPNYIKHKPRVPGHTKPTQVAGPVSVTLAGLTGLATGHGPPRLVVRVTTGELSGPVKLRMRADVLKQRSTRASEND